MTTIFFDRIRPEFTIRKTSSFHTSGPTLAAGDNIDDWFNIDLPQPVFWELSLLNSGPILGPSSVPDHIPTPIRRQWLASCKSPGGGIAVWGFSDLHGSILFMIHFANHLAVESLSDAALGHIVSPGAAILPHLAPQSASQALGRHISPPGDLQQCLFPIISTLCGAIFNIYAYLYAIESFLEIL